MIDPAPEKEQKFRPKTAADALVLRLREQLFDGNLVPGQTVSIRRIAAAEDVSVIPARDAMRSLVTEGALEFRDSRTITVPVLSHETLNDIRFARMAIETELADRGFSRLLNDIDEIEAIDDEITAALIACDAPTYMQTNRAFHFKIYQAANAPVLMHMAQALWLRFGPSMRIVCESFSGKTPDQDFHRVAIAALRTNDRTGFRNAIAADIAQGMGQIKNNIGTKCTPVLRSVPQGEST